MTSDQNQPAPKASNSRDTLLKAARFGEGSRQDLGLTPRESKRADNDPFMRRLDTLR